MRGVRWSPNFFALAIIWMLMIESPPSSKKLSWMPTVSMPRMSPQTEASVRSVSVRGAV